MSPYTPTLRRLALLFVLVIALIGVTVLGAAPATPTGVAAAGSISGRITAPGGAPIAGAFADGYLTEYYDEAPSRSEATPFTVTQPNPVAGIDFTLQAATRVSGRVLDFNTGQPIEEAEVALTDTQSGSTHALASMPGTGEFNFDVGPGSYVLTATKQGYASSLWSQRWAFNLTEGQHYSDIELLLAPAAYVRPRVFQADGSTPLSGIRIRAYNLTVTGHHLGGGAIGLSNNDGSFTEDMIVPAGWDIYARASRSNTTLAYMSTWYSSTGGALSITQAEPLNLAVGETREIAFAIHQAPSTTITPAAGGEIMLDTSFNTIITIPAGAVTEDVELTIHPELGYSVPPMANMPDGFFAYAATIDGVAVSSFALPYTITIEYEDQHIPWGVDELDLSLYHFGQLPDTQWGWINIPTTVDPVNNILTAELDFLSEFQIWAPRQGIFLPVVSNLP